MVLRYPNGRPYQGMLRPKEKTIKGTQNTEVWQSRDAILKKPSMKVQRVLPGIKWPLSIKSQHRFKSLMFTTLDVVPM